MGTTTISGSTKLPYSTLHSLLESGGAFSHRKSMGLAYFEAHFAVLDPEIKVWTAYFPT